MQHENNNQVGFEEHDIDVPKTIGAITAFVVVLVLFLVGLNDYFAVTADKLYYQQVLQPESVPLRELRMREAAILNAYRRLSPTTYAIPVEQAMSYLAEQSYKEGRKNAP